MWPSQQYDPSAPAGRATNNSLQQQLFVGLIDILSAGLLADDLRSLSSPKRRPRLSPIFSTHARARVSLHLDHTLTTLTQRATLLFVRRFWSCLIMSFESM